MFDLNESDVKYEIYIWWKNIKHKCLRKNPNTSL